MFEIVWVGFDMHGEKDYGLAGTADSLEAAREYAKTYLKRFKRAGTSKCIIECNGKDIETITA